MSQDIMPAGKKKCYACIQWDGQRSYYADKQAIKVDVGREGLCRITKKKIKGSSSCDTFFPLK